MIELLDPPNICVQNSGMRERDNAINITSLHHSGSEQLKNKINSSYGG